MTTSWKSSSCSCHVDVAHRLQQTDMLDIQFDLLKHLTKLQQLWTTVR